MRMLKQSVASNVMVLMTSETDHVSGKTGLTLTITASKDGGAFAGISPTVTERGNGWYNLALTAAHKDTLGDLVLHITGTGADPTDTICHVVETGFEGIQQANIVQVSGVAVAGDGTETSPWGPA